MKKALAAPSLLALLLLSACVAETVERRKPRKGPIKEVGFVDMGGGNVRYSVDGWGWFVAGRRRDALRRMRRNCGKLLAPQILDEYLRQDADISYAGEDITTNLDKGMDHFKIAPFQHLIYECRPKDAAYEPPKASTAVPRAILVVPPVSTVSTTTVIEAPAVSTATAPQEPPK
ncbi:MAG: hypothetical protein HYV14_13250 [Elusimicrobia bacterium]|nr:hypothetical protein [Elusimicrobiota bacterium]